MDGETFLDLQSAAKGIDDAWDFAQADNVFPGNISHMALPKKWQEVVFTETEKINVHLVVYDAESHSKSNIGLFENLFSRLLFLKHFFL